MSEVKHKKVFAKKSLNTSCYLLEISQVQSYSLRNFANFLKTPFELSTFPVVAKIDPSVLVYFSTTQQNLDQRNKEFSDQNTYSYQYPRSREKALVPKILSIEFHPFALEESTAV